MKQALARLTLVLGLLGAPALRATDAPKPTTVQASVETRVEVLLERMTLDEKLGQLTQYSNPDPNAATGPLQQANVEKEIAAGNCGSMLNVIGAASSRAMQKLAVEKTRLGIPLLFGFDVVHGFRTIFPINLGQAASWDLPAIERSERIAATEAAAAGVHWTFAPMVDIARDPRWGRIAEGAGEDTYLGSLIAAARVRGFQGDDLGRNDTIVACAKHFAAYGAAQAGRDYFTTDVPEITLRDVYLPPFKAAVDAGVGTFMAAFNDLNGTPCSANAFLMTQVLRKEWGFKGFVVSDWGSIMELRPHGIAADDAESGRLAFKAGVDMDMEGHIYNTQLRKLVESGVVPMSRVNEAVRAILATKMRLGLFEDPYRYCDEEREKTAMLTPGHLEAARDLTRKSCVLLQNNNKVLPLAKDSRIALVGPLADSARDMLGNWQGRGQEADAITLFKAMDERFPGKLKYAKGCEITELQEKSELKKALTIAKKSDVIVAALGESWDMSGEGYCRTNIDLPGEQLAFLKELKRTGKPVVVVLFTGRPLVLAQVLKHADAVLLAWLPGVMGGPAIADLLDGSFNPSGKLPVTFPLNLGQVPIFYSHKNSGRPQDDAKPRVMFRTNYIDSVNTPQFPFGYGLSYTRFSVTKTRVEDPVLRPGGTVRIHTTVTNTGDRAGTEVVQLYVRDVAGAVTRPVRELRGFLKVSLAPGEAREVSFTLRPADLAFHHADMSYAPEAGRFEIFIGGDSLAPLAGEFEYAER